MTCVRCGDQTPRHTLGQRYCPPCERDVAVRTAPKPATWRPTWMRWTTDHADAKDLTGLGAAL